MSSLLAALDLSTRDLTLPGIVIAAMLAYAVYYGFKESSADHRKIDANARAMLEIRRRDEAAVALPAQPELVSAVFTTHGEFRFPGAFIENASPHPVYDVEAVFLPGGPLRVFSTTDVDEIGPGGRRFVKVAEDLDIDNILPSCSSSPCC
jgi:hypothetical protein